MKALKRWKLNTRNAWKANNTRNSHAGAARQTHTGKCKDANSRWKFSNTYTLPERHLNTRETRMPENTRKAMNTRETRTSERHQEGNEYERNSHAGKTEMNTRETRMPERHQEGNEYERNSHAGKHQEGNTRLAYQKTPGRQWIRQKLACHGSEVHELFETSIVQTFIK